MLRDAWPLDTHRLYVIQQVEAQYALAESYVDELTEVHNAPGARDTVAVLAQVRGAARKRGSAWCRRGSFGRPSRLTTTRRTRRTTMMREDGTMEAGQR